MLLMPLLHYTIMDLVNEVLKVKSMMCFIDFFLLLLLMLSYVCDFYVHIHTFNSFKVIE